MAVIGGYVAIKYLLTPKIRREAEETKALLVEALELSKIETRADDEIHRPEVWGLERTRYGWKAQVRLPKGFTVEAFKKKLGAIEQATVSKIDVQHVKGREILLKLGMKPLRDRMDYDDSLLVLGELSLPYFTPFGVRHLNFSDEACCHLIVAGATRMGKTVFLRLLFTHLLRATSGKVKFYYVNNKLEDYYPLAGVPQIPKPAESTADAFAMLNSARQEIAARKEKLRASRDSVNVRQYNEKHPDDPIPPLFVVFDEYGRFAEDDDLQDIVTEIAETAGYLDVHLVIATQRPDATTVLKPRIRANILTRVCFQTADEKNSEIVVHVPDAYHLSSIRGRAVVLDGMPMLAQIPYISEDRAMELLQPFRSEQDVEPERPDDFGLSSALPGFVKGPVRPASMPGTGKAMGYGEPDYEAPRPRRPRNNRTPAQR
jgi:S-DNA-T family DNA segregation ATPase FtsK/SpoIIIE